MSDEHRFRQFWHAEIDTGQWWIDDVRLDHASVVMGQAHGCLRLQLPQGLGRLRVSDGEGRIFSPPGAVAYEHGGGCFHPMTEESQLLLPPGTYTVQGMRGFERRLYETTVPIVEGQEASLTVDLPRIIDGPQESWFAGDHHNHLSFHGATRYPLMSIDDVCHVARGEGLDYLSFCGELVDQHAFADWRDAGRPPHAMPDGAVDTEDFVCAVSHEITQDLLGHTCAVNGPGHMAPGHPWWIAPTNAEMFDAIRKGDGVGTVGAIALAHPYSAATAENLFEMLADPSRTGIQRELPVDVALGCADTMDILAVEEPADLEIRFRDYFRLLNLGLHIGVSAASDVYADQGTEIVGSLRTLVHSDGLDMNSIAMGYRNRRTVATNGPFLRFYANGARPGDTIEGPSVRLIAEAYSNWSVSKIEIISQGQVVAEASSQDGDGWMRMTEEMVFQSSGWLVARVYGPGHMSLNLQSVAEEDHDERGQWCVTSPIYVHIPERPLLPNREDAEYFIRWIDASCEAIKGRMAFLEDKGPNGPDMTEKHVQRALDLFARARAVYVGLLSG